MSPLSFLILGICILVNAPLFWRELTWILPTNTTENTVLPQTRPNKAYSHQTGAQVGHDQGLFLFCWQAHVALPLLLGDLGKNLPCQEPHLPP